MVKSMVSCVLAVAILVATAVEGQTCPDVKISGPQQLVPNEKPGKAGIFFGKYMRISGNWLLVGGYGKRRAYFFKRDAGKWNFRQKVNDKKGTGGDFFSLYLGLSGDVAVISSPKFPTFNPKNLKTGKVLVYEKSGTGMKPWAQVQTILPPGNRWNKGMEFGYGLDNQGNTIVVGARKANAKDASGKAIKNDQGEALKNVGGIFIYSRTTKGAKFKLEKVIYGVQPGAQWADDVVISGMIKNTGVPKIVVTAPRHPKRFYGAGFVFLKKDGEWNNTPQMLVPDESALPTNKQNEPHHFEGCGVYKNTIISGGERGASPVGKKTGAAWVWNFDFDTKTYSQGDGLFPDVPKEGSRHGQRLDVTALKSGKLIAFVGAWATKEAGLTKAGAVYWYVKCSDGSWSRGPKRIVLANPAEGDEFGNMVAIGNGAVAIGAPKRDTGVDPAVKNRGGVYVYNFEEN